jgi:hypothetical protein
MRLIFGLLKDEWLSAEHTLKRVEQRIALLTSRREIAPHPTEVACPVLGSKAARYFLLEFDHPQVTF